MKLSRRNLAFSLVEMLVALAVLSLLVVMLAQVISLSSESITSNSRKLSAVDSSRFVLDQIGEDLSSRLRRSDVGGEFTKSSLNDSFKFYSEVPSYDGTRKISLVSYRVHEDAESGVPELQRAALGTTWTEVGVVNTAGSSLLEPEDSLYDRIGDSVIRLEVCFLKRDGTLSNSVSSDLDDLAGVIVGIVTLDSESRNLLSKAQITALQSSLSDVSDGETPLETWNNLIKASNFAQGIPQKAVQRLKVAQRLYHVR